MSKGKQTLQQLVDSLVRSMLEEMSQLPPSAKENQARAVKALLEAKALLLSADAESPVLDMIQDILSTATLKQTDNND